MDSLAGQVLLAGQPRKPSIRQHCGGVIHTALKPHRQANRHDQSCRVRLYLQQHPPRHLLHARRLEGVFAAVAADA